MLRYTAKTVSTRRSKLITALIVLLPILSMLAGAALAAHRYGAI